MRRSTSTPGPTGLSAIKSAYPGFALAIEPGRYLVAEAGVLLLHATQVIEKDGVRRVGVDAGMNALMRPALYEAFHADAQPVAARTTQRQAMFDIVGPICESSDVLGQQRAAAGSDAPKATCCWSPTPAPTAWRWPTPTTCGRCPQRT